MKTKPLQALLFLSLAGLAALLATGGFAEDRANAEPGHNLHTPAEMGVDSFQADRSPTHMYRTAPLAGLWSHQKGGFYHDGRFATLAAVVEHYNRNFRLGLSDQEKAELIEYLKSI